VAIGPVVNTMVSWAVTVVEASSREVFGKSYTYLIPHHLNLYQLLFQFKY
jgi:hypothetical protein